MTHPTIDAAVTEAEQRLSRSQAAARIAAIALTIGLAVLVLVPMGLAYVAMLRGLWRAAFG